MNPFGWRRTRWVVPGLLFLAVILAAGLAFNLANLDNTGVAPIPVPAPGPRDPSSPISLLDLLPVIHALMVVLLGLTILAVVYLFLSRKQKRKIVPGRGNRFYLIQIAILLGVFLLLLFLPPSSDRSTDGTGGDPDPTGDGDGGLTPLDQPTLAGVSMAFFFAGALLVGLLLLSFLLVPRAFRRARLVASEPTSQRREAVAAVGAAIRSIELGEDARSTILRCFLRFCELLGARGIGRQDVLTPREIEGLAIERLRVSAVAVQDLTGVFEEARYSLHPLGPPERERALTSLERIRFALEG